MGATTKLIHGPFEEEATLEKVRTWCVGAAAATRFRGMRHGIGGSPTLGMYSAQFSPLEWKTKFGIEVDGWDQMEVIELSQTTVSDEEAYKFLDWMKNEYGGITAKENVMIMQIKMYLALKALIKERKYDFVTVRCLPELTCVYTTFCLAQTILNDYSDAEGPKESVVCGCECDANGTLTMQMLKHVAGQAVLFGDSLQIDVDTKEVVICNCGSMPSDFAKSHKDVIWVREGLVELPWKYGSANAQYVARSGLVTLARLAVVNGEYVMAITTGDAVEKDREKLREVNYNQPQAFVRLHGELDDFFDNLRSQHWHMVYGDYVKELELECRFMGIKPIVF